MSPLFSTSAGATIRAYGMSLISGVANFFWSGFANDTFATSGVYNSAAIVDSTGNVWMNFTADNGSFQPDILKLDNKGAKLFAYSYGVSSRDGILTGILPNDNPIFVWTRNTGTDIDVASNNATTMTNVWHQNIYRATGLGEYSVPSADSSGNTYVTLSTNAATFFLIKFDGSGNVVYQKTILGATGSSGTPNSIADSSGNVWIYTPDGVLARMNSAGTTQIYSSTTGIGSSTTPNRGRLVGTDSAGNGYFAINASAGGFVSKYNSSGVAQWGKTVTMGANLPSAIAVDSAGNSYCVWAGATTSTLLFYVMKFDTSGNISWQRSMTSSATNGYRGTPGITIALDNLNGMVITYTEGGATSANRRPTIFKLPTDGTKTGTLYGNNTYTYAASSLTIGSYTPGNLTNSGTPSNSTLTVSSIGSSSFNSGAGASATVNAIA